MNVSADSNLPNSWGGLTEKHGHQDLKCPENGHTMLHIMLHHAAPCCTTPGAMAEAPNRCICHTNCWDQSVATCERVVKCRPRLPLLLVPATA